MHPFWLCMLLTVIVTPKVALVGTGRDAAALHALLSHCKSVLLWLWIQYDCATELLWGVMHGTSWCSCCSAVTM